MTCTFRVWTGSILGPYTTVYISDVSKLNLKLKTREALKKFPFQDSIIGFEIKNSQTKLSNFMVSLLLFITENTSSQKMQAIPINGFTKKSSINLFLNIIPAQNCHLFTLFHSQTNFKYL